METKKVKPSQKKYPRVFLTKSVRSFGRLPNLEVHWSDGSLTGVYDISLMGASIVKTSRVTTKFGKGSEIDFEFSLKGKKFKILCGVIREDSKCVSVHFISVSPDAKKNLEKYLDLDLIASGIRLVDSKSYIEEQGFQFWFHGPAQTNIFIWGTSRKIKRATIEFLGKVLHWGQGEQEIFISESSDFLKSPTEDYAYCVNMPIEKKKVKKSDAFFKSVLGLLDEVKEPSGIILKLAQALKEAKL